MPHRIHASKETADLIIAAGKENWLIKREDPIVVKGKGEIETYWLNPTGRGSVHSVKSIAEHQEGQLACRLLSDGGHARRFPDQALAGQDVLGSPLFYYGPRQQQLTLGSRASI